MPTISRSLRLGSSTTDIRFGTVQEVLEKPRPGRSLIVCDENTSTYLADTALPVLVLRSGETNKNWSSINAILEKAVKLEMGRDSLFIGLGGGVICDMTGFAASIYMRGCRLLLVPTTLLSMVDASVGGKTGIDFGGYKNLVGTFYPAEEVFIAAETLASLPDREYKNGLAEVIKHGLLGAEDLLIRLETDREGVMSREAGTVELCISRSIDVKGDIVAQDVRESGIRAHLNLGHTFAHALESAAGLAGWSHGEAVAWGIDRAMQAGVAAGITDPAYAGRVERLLRAYAYRIGPLPEAVEAGAFLSALKRDKKKREGGLRFVLQRSLGDTLIRSLDRDIIQRVLTTNHVS